MEEKQTVINILGTDYEILYKETEKMAKIEADGLCDPSSKKIYVANIAASGIFEDPTVHEREVVRHEVIHAMLHESGLSFNSSWATEEEMVDFFALQFPKLADIFKKLGV